MDDEKSLTGESAPPLQVQIQGSGWSLPAGPSYLVGRDPGCDIVVADGRVSWQHAVLRLEEGRWVLADNGSTNGIYAGDRRVSRIEIDGRAVIRLSHPYDGPSLSCTVTSAVTMLRIGRAPDNDIVVSHPSVSGYHAELHQLADGYRLVDLDSSNGTYVNERRVTAAPLAEGDVVGIGSATFRLAGHELREVSEPAAPVAEILRQPATPAPAAATAVDPRPVAPPPAVPPPAAPPGDGPLEIPYAVRWLVPKGERFANFDILNDNDTQLDYYRRFGHIYAVGIPTKKWRLVVVSDPELLDEVAANEEQFGKRVEEINFFAQLSHSRGGGISVIGDGEHYEQVRRVMLPWYAPSHQRTQLERMKEQARRLVAAWSVVPDHEPLDARAWMERYTLEVSGRGACSYNLGLLDGVEDPHAFAAAVPESTKESILRVAEPAPDFTLFAARARRERKKRYDRHNEELA